jgi:hypothetical protein
VSLQDNLLSQTWWLNLSLETPVNSDCALRYAGEPYSVQHKRRIAVIGDQLCVQVLIELSRAGYVCTSEPSEWWLLNSKTAPCPLIGCAPSNRKNAAQRRVDQHGFCMG